MGYIMWICMTAICAYLMFFTDVSEVKMTSAIVTMNVWLAAVWVVSKFGDKK